MLNHQKLAMVIGPFMINRHGIRVILFSDKHSFGFCGIPYWPQFMAGFPWNVFPNWDDRRIPLTTCSKRFLITTVIRHQWVTRINKILLLTMSYPACKPLKTRRMISKDVRTILISHQMSPVLASLMMESYLLVGIILTVSPYLYVSHNNPIQLYGHKYVFNPSPIFGSWGRGLTWIGHKDWLNYSN